MSFPASQFMIALQNNPPLPSEKLSIPALAERLGKHEKSVWRWVRKGCHGCLLRVFEIGERTFTTWAFYEAWQAEVSAKRSAIRAAKRHFRETPVDIAIRSNLSREEKKRRSLAVIASLN